jgi:hypothetical protein
VRDAWWIIEGATRVRVDSFEAARNGACERADVVTVLATQRDRWGDPTWGEARGRERVVLIAREDALLDSIRSGVSVPS